MATDVRHNLEAVWAQLSTHEAVCGERYKTLTYRLTEVEDSIKGSNKLVIRVLLAVSGTLITALGFVVWATIMRK
jgi:hypothetical protein